MINWLVKKRPKDGIARLKSPQIIKKRKEGKEKKAEERMPQNNFSLCAKNAHSNMALNEAREERKKGRKNK
jgi:hypothetical protein